mgnify:CR=1 FL=1
MVKCFPGREEKVNKRGEGVTSYPRYQGTIHCEECGIELNVYGADGAVPLDVVLTVTHQTKTAHALLVTPRPPHIEQVKPTDIPTKGEE